MRSASAGEIGVSLRKAARIMPILFVLAAFGLSDAAHAAAWRFGNHSDYERVVVPLPAASTYVASVEPDGSYVFKSDGFTALPQEILSGKRIVQLSGANKRVSMKLAAGALPKVWRSGNRLVIDVYFAAKDRKAPSPAGKPLPKEVPKVAPGPILSTSVSQAPLPALVAGRSLGVKTSSDDRPVHKEPLSSSAARPATISAVLSQAVTVVELRAATGEFPSGYFVVPAASDVGAAAFLRAGMAEIILDAALSLDISSLKDDPAYGGTSLHVLQGGTQIEVRGGAVAAPLRVLRQPAGWLVGFGKVASGRTAIAGSESHGRILLNAASPSAVVVLEDAQTGARLLVGTMRSDGSYTAAGRQTPEFIMPSTFLGVVVSPSTDRIDLKTVANGFELAEWSGAALATAGPQPGEVSSTAAAAMTRRFDLPDLPLSMLRIRLHGALRDAALAPKAARTDARMRVAQAMLALGMDVEAGAVLSAAAADDPAFDQVPGGAQLRRIAAWLAGRRVPIPIPADWPRAEQAQRNDEGLFWDTVLDAGEMGIGRNAALLAATWPVPFNYPPALRSRVLPRLADLLLKAGQKEALAGLLKDAPDAELDYARAQAASADGQTDAALALFDHVAGGGRRDDAAQARRAAVELRLTAKKIDVKTAAELLKNQLYAWRGDDRELDLRFRLAALLAQSGAWRPALTMLRETDQLFPAAHPSVHDTETNLVATLLQGDAAPKMPALELVALVGECADILGENADASILAPVLVDKLLALDLPARAEPILVRLLKSTSGAAPKAELGLRLASLRLARNDAPGAATALNDSQSDGLPAELDGRRLLLKARIRGVVGDTDGALQLLASLNNAEALDQSATLLEQGRNWKRASAALARLVPLRIPPGGKLNDSQADLVLRLASDEAQAGDAAALAEIQSTFAPRLKAGMQASLLRVLTQSPVEAVSDLGRASQELAAARQLPGTLAAPPSP